MNFKLQLVFISIFAVILLVIINEYNVHQLNNQNIVGETMITTADEASYFSPARNFLKNGVWKDSQIGKSAYFTRTPGYGSIYMFCELLYPSNPYKILKIIQISLYFLQIYVLGLLIYIITGNKKRTLIFLFILSILPCFSGFVYYTLSESVGTSFFIFSIYFSRQCVFNIKQNILKASFFWAITIMVRPQLLLPAVFVCLYLFFSHKKAKYKVIIAVSFLPLLAWQVRNTIVAGKYPGFHPIYHETNQSLFRKPHALLTDYFRIIEYRGEVFHFVAYQSAYGGNEGIERSLDKIDPKYRADYREVLINYQAAMLSAQKVGDKIQNFTVEEKNFIQYSELKLYELQHKYELEYFVLTPWRSFKYLFFSSNMNLNIYQAALKDNIFIIFIKYLCCVLNLLGLFSGIILLFLKIGPFWKFFIVSVLFSIIYLVYIQRFNEERYLYPFLPFLYLFTILLIEKKPLLLWKNKRSKGLV